MKTLKQELERIGLNVKSFKTSDEAFSAIIQHYVNKAEEGANERLSNLKSKLNRGKVLSDELISILYHSYKEKPFILARRLESEVLQSILKELK